MANLSPAAQAVLDAYISAPCGKPRSVWVAATLRAAVKQCSYTMEVFPDSWGRTITESFIDPEDLLTIANDLEGITKVRQEGHE
jgi:hypothetical protein